MRQLLRAGAEFDSAAVDELSQIFVSLRDSAAAAGGMAIAEIAETLLLTLREMAMPSRHVSVVEELALWHLFVKLKAAAAGRHEVGARTN